MNSDSEILEQRRLIQTNIQHVSALKDDIKYLKKAYEEKLEDIFLESVATQEELALQRDLGSKKTQLIASQNDEILALKEAIAILQHKNAQLEHVSKEKEKVV